LASCDWARIFLARIFLARIFLARIFLARFFLARIFLARVFLARIFLARVFFGADFFGADFFPPDLSQCQMTSAGLASTNHSSELILLQPILRISFGRNLRIKLRKGHILMDDHWIFLIISANLHNFLYYCKK
jgi:hypothetical protein